MQKRRFLSGFLAGILLTSLVFLVMTTAFAFYSRNDLDIQNGSEQITKQERYEIANKLSLLEQYIDKFYLNKLSAEDYANGLYKGLFSSLNDPYAAYYTEEEYSSVKDSTEGKYAGIGAYIRYDGENQIYSIVTAYENGPAAKAGLQNGDILLSVDDKNLSDKDLTEVSAMMKGKPGTKVKIEVIRDTDSKPLEFVVTRAEVEADTVHFEMLNEESGIGYLSISSFKDTTVKQFNNAISQLKKMKMKALILDVRDNGGGSLSAVVSMLDRILPEGLIVYTRDKNDKGKEYFSTNEQQLDVPMALLVNENSASASEVFAGALKDHNKAVLVGTKTFGKGIVQSLYPLKDGSAVKLTTSKYYTPSGKNIHDIGIMPDVLVEFEEGVLDTKHPSITEDEQLKAAVASVEEQLNKKK